MRMWLSFFLCAVFAVSVNAQSFHSTDTSQDGSFNLGELLRVIQLYNADALRCEGGTEDGYAPGTGNQECSPHAADYAPQDWSVSLSELLRNVQLYNTGAYYACSGSEDDFCPGADPGLEGEGDGSGELSASFFVGTVSGQAPLSVQFLDASTPGSSPIESWAWSFGDSTTSTERSPTKVYNGAGTYTVSLTVTSAHGSDTFTRADLITVEALSPALLTSSSPANDEDGVAVTRETILTFSAPLDPAILSNTAVSIHAGTQPVSTYRNLSPDGRTLTLFPSSPLPGNRTVRIDLDGALLTTIDGRQVDVDGDGLAGGTSRISYSTLSLGALRGTSVSGRVFASGFGTGQKGAPTNIPLAGVEIFIDGRFDLRTTTDVNGNFRLEPVPAGEFFVHINGIDVETSYIDGIPVPTSFPDGPYYPFVGKRWEAVAGRDNSVGDIFLPLIPEGALTELSPTQPTRITWASGALGVESEYEGAFLLVPPNALYNDFGTRGGSVGMAPVAPDRLPSPLPPGLELPLVITVQTDGPNNFDLPVPVCLPNTPDPDTGEALPPGASSALWSFDHDEGDWKVVGTMRVSEDGRLVCTDPGMGIIEPGWHGTTPATQPGPLPTPPIQFPPFEHPHFCDIPEQECINSILFSSLDLFASAIPFAGVGQCAVGLGYGAITSWRDCASLTPGAGCQANVLGTLGSGLDDCRGQVTRGIPILGILASGFDLVVSTLDSCTCVLNKNDKGTAGSLSVRALAYSAYFQSLQDLFAIQYGDIKWTNLTTETPNLLQDGGHISEILNAVEEAILEDSGGGATIDAQEAADISAMPLPDSFSQADVDALITYRNMTEAQWGLGLFTHVAAGRTDFIDQTDLLAALDAVLSAMNSIDPATDAIFDPQQMVLEIYSGLLAEYAEPGEQPTPFGETDFLLTDLDSGTKNRGRIQERGFLPIAALAPLRTYRLSLFHLPSRSYAEVVFRSAANGETTEIPPYLMRSIASEQDSDADGLPDLAEAVYNTLSSEPDSDGDGLSDLAELELGSNPLDGFLPGTGILATVDTPGEAENVAAANDFVAVAEGVDGVSIFNVYNGMPPVIVAQMDTDGQAVALAARNNTIAVADRWGGLALLDVSNAVDARRITQLDVGADVFDVVIDGSHAYAITTANELLVVDVDAGSLLNRVVVGEGLGGMAVADGTLAVMGVFNLNLFTLDDGLPMQRGSFSHGRIFVGSVFLGGEVAYYIHFDGYDTVDLSDLDSPTQLGRHQGGTVGTFTDIAVDGGELAWAVYTRAFNESALGVFDATDSTETESFLAEYDTPATPRAVALHAGLAYVAYGINGLSVLAHREPDTSGVAPTVGFIVPNAAGSSLERGREYRMSVNAVDDVQVKEVELRLNGTLAQMDRSYPYEFQFTAPSSSASSTLSVSVVATDTGSNRSVNPPVNFTLNPDVTPPVLRNSNPIEGRLHIGVSEITLRLSEPLNAGVLSPDSLTLLELGADGQPGGGDDTIIALSAPELASGGNLIRVSPAAPGPLPDGLYQLQADKAAIADAAGNSPPDDIAITFAALEASDGSNVFNNLAGGSWNDRDNWSGGTVPLFNEQVRISIPNRQVAVTVDGGTQAIAGLDTDENIVVPTGSELALRGASSLRGSLEVSGGFSASGSAAVVSLEGTVNAFPGCRIEAHDGADLTLQAVTTLSDVSLRTVNAALRLPALGILTDSNVSIDGGVALLGVPFLANIDGSSLDVNAAMLSLPLVTALSGSNIAVQGGGTVTLAGLTGTTNAGFQVSEPGSTLNLPILATMTNPSVISYSGASLTFPALANVVVDQSGATFSLYAGGVMDLHLLSAVELDNTVDSLASLLLYAEGAGMLDASGLTAITRTGGGSLSMNVGGGATLDLSSLTAIEDSSSISLSSGGQLLLDAAIDANVLANVFGNDSLLYAPLLETLDGTMTLQDAALDLPALVTLTGNLTLQADSAFTADSLESVEGGSITMEDVTATFDAPVLTTLENVSLGVYGGAALALHAVTAYTVTDASATLFVQGNSSSLSLPSLALLQLDGSASFQANVGGGAQCSLALLSAIITPSSDTTVFFAANGTGSTINLPSLTSVNNERVTFVVSDSGIINRP